MIEDMVSAFGDKGITRVEQLMVMTSMVLDSLRMAEVIFAQQLLLCLR